MENMLTVALWQKAVVLYHEAQKQGQELGRKRLAELLNITDSLARKIVFALNNQDIINCTSMQLETKEIKKELLIGDIHIPFQDKAAISVMLDYAEEYQPDIISIMGDLIDCYEISDFDKNPLRGKRLFEEIGEAREFLYSLRNRFPDSRIIYYLGNHEQRIERYICNRAEQLAELVATLLIDKLELKELNIEYVTEPFAIGKLWHVHGNEKPKGAYNPQHICDVMMKYIYDDFVVFHYHRVQTQLYRRVGDRYFRAYSVGYLAKEFDYSKLNQWQQGFATCEYDETGEFTFNQKVIMRGVIH